MVCSHQADEKLFSHWEEVRAQEILKQLHAFTAGLPGIQHTVIHRPPKVSSRSPTVTDLLTKNPELSRQLLSFRPARR